MTPKQTKILQSRLNQTLALEEQDKLKEAGIRSALCPGGPRGWHLLVNEKDQDRVQEVLGGNSDELHSEGGTD